MGTILSRSQGRWLAGESPWYVCFAGNAKLRVSLTEHEQFFVACEPALSGYSVRMLSPTISVVEY